jgi:hypothetical protein
MAIDWTRLPPEIKPGHVRSEETQACAIAELLELYDDADVYGAYVYDFVQPQLPHSTDARFDLDMASYGIVRPLAHGDTARWQRKAAFETVAAHYGKARKQQDWGTSGAAHV